MSTGVKVNFIGKNAQACGIALTTQQIHQRSSRIDRKIHFIGIFRRWIIVKRIIHRRRTVNHNLAAKVGFFLVPFYVQTVGSSEELPVDIFNRLALIVKAMFGKLNRKTMKRAFVKSGNKPFNHLTGKQFKRAELIKPGLVYGNGHRFQF